MSIFHKRAIHVTVNVTPDCVIRPGDTVLIGTGDRFGPIGEKRVADAIRARLAPHMPKGSALIFWPVGDSGTVINISWLLQQLSNQRGNNGGDHDGK
jgi:hypothetical protein